MYLVAGEIKPALDDDLLMHFGVKGMRWGHRKARETSSKSESSQPAKPKMSTGKKLAIGAAVVVGAAAVVALGTKTGRTKVSESLAVSFVQNRQRKAQQGKSPFEGLIPKQAMQRPVSRIPSPDQMIADARMAGVRNRVNREGNARIFDRAWRDSARIQKQVRDLDDTTQNLVFGGNIDKLRSALNDPNHVWQL